MTEGCPASILTYGILSPADLRASEVELTPEGTRFILTYKNQSVPCLIPLIGRFNVYNSLAAASVGLIKGASLQQVADILQTAPSVTGRLQPIPNALGLKIYVDFAHSDDALVNVLECLQELKKGRIITVFGCGGDRDKGKRPKMAQAVSEYSELSIVTSDNPRTEDPEAIAREVVQGFKKQSSYLVVLDRREAIRRALEEATRDDIILIAGKGHETYQVFAHKTVEFDDAKVAAQLCNQMAQQTIQAIHS